MHTHGCITLFTFIRQQRYMQYYEILQDTLRNTHRERETDLFLGIGQVLLGLHQQLFHLGGLLLPLIQLGLQRLWRQTDTGAHTQTHTNAHAHTHKNG